MTKENRMSEEDMNEIVEAGGPGILQMQLYQRKARKMWSCKSCGKAITPGTRYWNRIVKLTGEHRPLFSEHFCLSCEPSEPVMKRILDRQREYLRVLN